MSNVASKVGDDVTTVAVGHVAGWSVDLNVLFVATVACILSREAREDRVFVVVMTVAALEPVDLVGTF